VCLIVFDWRPHAPQGAKLTLAANRDEFYARPAAPLTWWSGAPQILAGRDLQGGGTWLGITRSGRFAALTNFRAPGAIRAAAPSRGALVAGFLQDHCSPADYLAHLAAHAEMYSGFNLLVGDLAQGELSWFNNCAAAQHNRAATPQPGAQNLAAGCYGLSNALLDTPWPKVQACKAALRACLATPPGDSSPAAQREALLDMMHDGRIAPDAALPDTGLTLERERALSAAYISLPDYGTRCTTILQVSASGSVTMMEQGDSMADGQRAGTSLQRCEYHFQISSARGS
jgi:uncharacterized protein with NRDE domain